MAKSYITLDTRIDSFKDEFNSLVNKVGDIAVMSTSGTDSDVVGGINNLDSDVGTRTSLTTTADQNLVVAINEIDAELGTITAGAMGTTASTVSAAIAEIDSEADSDRTNFGANVKAHMLADGVVAQFTATANNSTNETVFPVFVDGATGAQGAETDTGLTYNPSSGNLTIGGALSAATLDISGDIDFDGTTNLDVVDIDGAVQIDATVTVGVDDTGYDVKFFGDTASAFMQWDASADDLIIGGAGGLIVPDGQLTLGSTAVTSTAAELNLLDGVSGLVQADFTKLAAITSSATELNLLDGVSGLVQADFTKLAAMTLSAADLNILAGGTSATSTTVVDADRVVFNDDGTMKQVAVTDLAAYFDDEITAMPNLVSVGALNSGSITSGFTSIDVGSGAITTTGTITAGAITVGDAVLSEAELEILDGANVTTAELNIMDGGTSATAITVVDGDRFVMNDDGTMLQVAASTLKTYFGQATGGTAITTLDIDGAADIGAAIVDADLFIVDDGAGGTNRKTTASRLLTYTNAGTLTTAAQTNITTLGRLDSAQIDDIKINGSTIETLSGTDLNITPLAGQQIVLDGTIAIDAGVVTGATSITSTAFVGDITGDVTGNADTSTLATSVTVSANNTANETVFLTHVDGATGTQGLETDTTLTYNPSTGVITTTGFTGALTGNASTATTLETTRAISISGDVTASGVNFNGSAAIALNTSLANNAVTTAKINADAITGAKIADDAINSEHYTDASIDFAHIQNVAANSILGRNANSSGVLSEVALATTQILIGDGTGFTAAALSGDVTMDNAGAVTIASNAVEQAMLADDVVSGAEMKTLRTFTLKDSSGSTLFTMFGAGAAT